MGNPVEASDVRPGGVRAGMKDQRGFTLLELLVIVGTIAITLAVLAPGVRRAQASFAVRQAANLIVTELRRAQAQAMAEGVDIIVEFDVVTGSQASTGLKVYRVGSSTPIRVVDPPQWPDQMQILAASPAFAACTAPQDPANQCATYKPLGYPTQAGQVRVQALGSSSSVRVVMEAATGRVSVQR